MKDTLSRILGTPVDVTKSDVYIALAAEFEAFKAEANGVAEAYSTQVNELTAQLASVSDLVASLQAQLDEAKAAQATAAEQAAVAKAEARKQKIVAAVGEDKAPGLIAATESMEDAQFDAVMAALGVAADAEAKSPLFNEIGVSAETTVAPTSGESEEMKILKARHQGAKR